MFEFLAWIRVTGWPAAGRGVPRPVAGPQHGGGDRAGPASPGSTSRSSSSTPTLRTSIHPACLLEPDGVLNGNVDVIQKRIIRRYGVLRSRQPDARGAAHRLPADRGARDRRRPADGGPGRHRRHRRLVLPGPLRRPVAVRRAAGRPQGRLLLAVRPDHAPEADVPAGHQHPAHPVPRRGGGRRGHRLHGAGDQQHPRRATCWSGRPARSAAGPPSSWPATRRSTTAGSRTRSRSSRASARSSPPRPGASCCAPPSR